MSTAPVTRWRRNGGGHGALRGVPARRGGGARSSRQGKAFPSKEGIHLTHEDRYSLEEIFYSVSTSSGSAISSRIQAIAEQISLH